VVGDQVHGGTLSRISNMYTVASWFETRFALLTMRGLDNKARTSS
jgi:hypothetical protein